MDTAKYAIQYRNNGKGVILKGKPEKIELTGATSSWVDTRDRLFACGRAQVGIICRGQGYQIITEIDLHRSFA